MSNNPPIYAFSVSGYRKELVIKGFENPDYNIKRVKFELRRVKHIPNSTPLIEKVAILSWRQPSITVTEPGEYHVIPMSGKLRTLQHMSFIAKSDTISEYLRQSNIV